MKREIVKLVIDTDGVCDDVRAISLALQSPNVQVIAISCVNGCIPVHQVVANVARTLRANNAANVPIYKGAVNPLIGNKHLYDAEAHFFGSDGIGNVPDISPKASEDDFDAYVKGMHAAQALIEIFECDPGITLTCIGPLTNVALALKLNPNFAKMPKQLVVMGGNIHGAGNVRSNSTAEFNFSMDPEAAHIVLKEMKCNITIVPWEAFLNESIKTNLDFHAHLTLDAPLAKFFEAITSGGRSKLAQSSRQYAFCDEIAIGAAIAPERIIKRKIEARASVELHGEYTRGQCALDWTDLLWSNSDVSHKIDRTQSTVSFIEDYDVVELDQMIHEAIHNSVYSTKTKANNN